MHRSPFSGRYEQELDRESAYEMLKKKAELQVDQPKASSPTRTSNRQSAGEALLTSAARAIGSTVGRQIIRGIMGSLLGGRR